MLICPSIKLYINVKLNAHKLIAKCHISGKQSAGQFHKKNDNTFFYEDMYPYFLDNFAQSVGQLQTERDPLGTCFRVGNQYVMTAYHVVENHIGKIIFCLTIKHMYHRYIEFEYGGANGWRIQQFKARNNTKRIV